MLLKLIMCVYEREQGQGLYKYLLSFPKNSHSPFIIRSGEFVCCPCSRSDWSRDIINLHTTAWVYLDRCFVFTRPPSPSSPYCYYSPVGGQGTLTMYYISIFPLYWGSFLPRLRTVDVHGFLPLIFIIIFFNVHVQNRCSPTSLTSTCIVTVLFPSCILFSSSDVSCGAHFYLLPCISMCSVPINILCPFRTTTMRS